MNYTQVENYIAKAEQTLNPIDWIPFIASYSGMVRILAGAVEIAVAAIFAYIAVARIVMAGRRDSFKRIFKEVNYYSFHGALNIGRGALAMLPIANLLLALYDWKIGRVNYICEDRKSGVFRIATQFTCPLSRRRV